MITTEHVIEIDDIELRILDLSTSQTMMHIKEQVYDQDEYGLRKMEYHDGDVIIDIGANVGSVSLYLGKKYPFLKIYAFEAHPINYMNLVKNIENNNIKNIECYNLAVSSNDTDILKITLNPNNTGSSSLFKISENDKINTCEVKTISLDTIIENNKINKIKFLKIDCEGSEFDILENSKLINQIDVENLSVEIHTFMVPHNKNVDNLIKLIKEISTNPPIYKVYSLG